MNIKVSLIKATCASALVLSSSLSLYGQPSQPDADVLAGPGTLQQPIPTNQLIIKYRENRLFSAAEAMSDAQMARLSAKAGVALTYFRPMSGDAHVLRLPQRLPLTEVERIAAQLSTLPEVEYAEPDYVMLPMLTPNDSLYNQQWHYYETYGINLPQAWDITTGNASTVVAVIDTGHRPHADLASRIVGGYDFISDPNVANDGNGRDSNPEDPGDWVTNAESSDPNSPFYGCPPRPSSWHGTHVAGTIGAVTNNGQGVAGVNWQAKLLTVRVLGKCGGYTSDIIDGMRWAAGLSVTGVPNNPHPAKVLNLSLGGSGTCPAPWQLAINAVNAAGAVVVVAAGNSNANAANYTPASCNGVITVGATNRNGVRASYSNYGSVVDISAPGGQMPPSSNGVLSTLNAGTTTPGTDNYAFYQGTSMAAPHVAGVVSLMVGLRPALNWSLVETILKNTAKPFGPGHTCTGATTCGAGIVNAHAALQATLNIKQAFLPIITGGSGSGSGGSWVNITQESFEGSTFPPSDWSTDGDSWGWYRWGRRNCLAYHGNFAAWAVAGGLSGSTLTCGSNYPNNVSTALTYGPFDLSDATAAQLSFRYNLNSEPGRDFLYWAASVNDYNYYGQRTSGNSGGWVEVTFDLSSYIGRGAVWIGFFFTSDSSNNFPYGALIDNVVVRKCVGGTCTGSLSQQEGDAPGWESAELILGVPYQPPPKP